MVPASWHHHQSLSKNGPKSITPMQTLFLTRKRQSGVCRASPQPPSNTCPPAPHLLRAGWAHGDRWRLRRYKRCFHANSPIQHTRKKKAKKFGRCRTQRGSCLRTAGQGGSRAGTGDARTREQSSPSPVLLGDPGHLASRESLGTNTPARWHRHHRGHQALPELLETNSSAAGPIESNLVAGPGSIPVCSQVINCLQRN